MSSCLPFFGGAEEHGVQNPFPVRPFSIEDSERYVYWSSGLYSENFSPTFGGCRTGRVARTLLSLKTVRNHVSNILLELQVAGRAQAVIRAREDGMGGDRA